MSRGIKKLLYFTIIISGAIFCSALFASANPLSLNQSSLFYGNNEISEENEISENDQNNIKYSVKKTYKEDWEDLDGKSAIDLKTPSNIKEEIEYDYLTDSYVYKTKVGDQVISIPFNMTKEEYLNYTQRKLIQSYFNGKNAELLANKGNDEFNFLDMQFGLGPAEKIFGPGGIQVKTQGSAEISFGLKRNKIENPSLPAKSRNKTYFDFDEKIQLNVNAKVGDKMNFALNYNTDATFDFDAQQLKLSYQGKEDEIIKNLEAGNVSMTTGSSLIRGGAALFGVKTQLQFGKLNVTALLAQQESSSQSVSSKGGAQTRSFEFTADSYDEDRHFFLSHYFRDNYDKFISKLPYISSGIEITKIEVWVTNKRGNYDQARNIVAFMDLAESSRLANDYWTGSFNVYPSNTSNNLFQTIVNEYPDARNINQVTQALAPLSAYNIDGGKDFEKVESARKMAESEFILNKSLGYISLRAKLNSDEVLAVAFEYTVNGKSYQVGEFSTSSENSQQTMYLKLLKGTSVNTRLPMWKLMMKNVYSLNSYQVQKDKFKLDIQYMSDTTGVYLNYIQAGNIADQLLLRVLNMDRLDSQNETNPDGYFDYVEGYTVISSMGRVIFPSVEPFGSYLASKIGDKTLADKYCYQELYDSTLTIARQVAEKNKFRIKGEYKSSSGSEINLNAMNVPRGSVVVTAGGVTLTENTDYTVDYTMGIVTILNQSILESGTNINVSLENQSMFSMQRKTMMGLDVQYQFNKNFNVGATVMHLSEKPLTQKVNMDDIPLNNTIYGFNASYKTNFMWLTNLMGAVPWINATSPSTFSVSGEFAQLKPGHSKTITKDGHAYLDDFESSQTGYDIRSPYAWQMASTPYDPSSSPLFPEAALSNDVAYGKNRALLNWYNIDRLFTQKNSSLTPAHLKKDNEQLSNHYVREVSYSEIYPNKELSYGESGVLNVMNLSFYPKERGPYNLDWEGIDDMGYLTNPQKRWGGMMRKVDNTDFEAQNIEYIQFWMMDPFIYDSTGVVVGGDMYFNLGEVSEDILKDGMKSFENGLPIDGDTTYLATTVWGRVSKRTSTVYAFETASGARAKQDVGFNGLSTNDEFNFSTYKNYVERARAKLSDSGLQRLINDPFSFLNDPAGDNYHYYRGSDYDNQELDILSRYKRYNGVEGNSTASEDSPEKYDISARTTPDVEDINQDNTLNEYERYYQYKISVRPSDLTVGNNYVSDVKSSKVKLRNGKEEVIKWYQFKIPLSEYQKKVGSINDFKTIRFIRVFLTNFEKDVHLRFASMELMRGDWRTYTQTLHKPNVSPITNGSLTVSVVNIEENAGSVPVNYVMPPGVTRVVDPGQSQITQLNEQSMALKINDLAPADARAVYKNVNIDMRQYKRLQMFAHNEAFIDNITNLKNGELSIFLRLGSDYKDNYYEYEIPLTLTEAGVYSNNSLSDRKKVWPENNMFDFPLSLLTDLKLERNAEKRKSFSTVTFNTVYSIYDPENLRNKASIVGNPSLSEVKTIMVGVRNNSKSVKDGIVWVDELRLAGFNEEGGWAAKANASLGISDIASVNVAGQIETAGFGSVDQGLSQRRIDNYYQYNISTQVDAGRLLPEQVKLKAPVYYSYSQEVTSPEYDPYNQDIKLSQSLENCDTKAQRDSIRNLAQEVVTVESFSVSGLKFNVQSEKPMPWDPANLNMSYSYSRTSKHDPTTEFENNYTYRGSLGYSYSPYFKPWTPFSNIKSKSPYLRLAKDFTFNWLPNNIGLYSNINRTYYEQQLRNVDESGMSGFAVPISFSKNFLWDRQTSISWDILKSIKLNYNAATNARIDEPNVPVNKRLYPDEYEIWKDSVRNNLMKLGAPIKFNQTFDVNFNIPLNKIPLFDWTTASLKYNSSYAWNKGTYVDEFTNLGNNINNQGQYQGDVKFNFENLYNKSTFLKETNKKFASSNRASNNKNDSKSKKKFSQRIVLKKDTTVTVRHNLDNKNLKVTAQNNNKEPYSVKYKVKDKNTIIITTNDSIPVQLSIIQGKRPEEETWYKMAQYSARTLMAVRNASIGYKRTMSTYLPSFEPMVGDFLGQNNSSIMAPGLGFAFGFESGETFVEKALNNNWLIVNDSLTTPASYAITEDLQYKITIEPFRDLKIDLNGTRAHTRNTSHQFMFPDVPRQQSGTFTMTTIAIKTSLNRYKAENYYQSDAFDNLVKYRSVVSQRIMKNYEGTTYPNAGFLANSHLAGTSFNKDIAGDRLNSADVLIPSFIAAYTGRDPGKVNMSPFPSILSVLPNWKITYGGLVRLIPGASKYLRSININHAYRCTYSVGSFASFLNYIENSQGLGFALDATNDCPIPSSPYDISTVSITESFAPLIGFDLNFKNGVTGKIEYKDTRNLSLNISSIQVVESVSKDITFGAGYKIANFNTVIGMKGGGQKGVNHDLILRGDFSFRKQNALIRKIDENYTQATSGNKSLTLKFTADYTFSKYLTIRGYYDKQINTPLVSSSSYPISNSNFGVTLKLALTR